MDEDDPVTRWISGLKAGDEGLLFVRPERLRLQPPGAGFYNTIASTVLGAFGVTLDLARGVLRGPRGDAHLRPIAPFAQKILAAGGVVAYLKEHGDFPSVG